jgi:putative membrane protein
MRKVGAHMPMYYYPGMSGAGMAVWMIVSTIFWVVVASVIVWALVRLVTHISRQPDTSPRSSQPTAKDILKARYAHGEVDTTTFREMMAHLTETEEVPPSNEVRAGVSGTSTPWSTMGSGIPTGLL